MEFISFVYTLIAFSSLLYFYLIWSESAKPKTTTHKAPPEASGAWPVIGHLRIMSGHPSAGIPHVNLGMLADKHGPIFSIRLGVHRVVVVSSPEVIKELFTTNDVAVSSRPSVKAGKHLAYDNAMLGFASYGAYWRQLRKIVSLELLSNRRLELQSHVSMSETGQFVKELYKLWEKKKSDGSGTEVGEGVVVDMKRWLGELNMNVVMRMVAGKRFGSGDNAEETKRCRRVMGDFFYLAGFFVPADALPYLGWLDLGGHEKRMKKAAKELDEVVGEWLAEHREREFSGEGKAQDFMDVMISVVKGADLQCEFDVDTIIKATCGTLIAGGTDTTAVVFVWALSLLLNHSHVLKKAQQELDKHVGKDRRVKESDLNNLIYLQAIVKETLRLYPPGPLAGTRRFTEDCVVGGYYIPKDTWLIVNLWKLQRDPRVWSDPLEFRPERFLAGDKTFDVKGQDFELIPFGAGRRICPGLSFGLQMLHLVLASLLQAFDMSTVSDEAVDMSESAGLTNMKATPLDVVVTPRLPPRLYNEIVEIY
uniref:Flavonoid-6-hydroxylase n=1 Tax=Ocimum basilicum TaxID=39350 RepID=F6H_OCIBA|nr:RecName: Full=Flavonoid-6-hydroxylase; Short=ObF6H; AltName: Full=CYP450 monooxygenase 82D33; AltName: Full=Cytochrome P450 82D33 [Ocimum basilicum]AGF30364.1 CYP450 monooxygenase CYP82D33 [Ocimum basilicum]